MTRTPYDTPIRAGTDEWQLALCEMEADDDPEAQSTLETATDATPHPVYEASGSEVAEWPDDDCSSLLGFYRELKAILRPAGAGEPAEVPQLMRRQAF